MGGCHFVVIVGSLVLVCPKAPASLRANHVTYAPAPPFRGENREAPEPVHPPDGEGVPTTLSPISSSGAISNAAATAMSYSMEPPSAHHSWFEIEKPRKNITSKVSATMARQHHISLPRARRNC